MTILESMATPLDWADEVLDAKTMAQVEDIRRWVRHQKALEHSRRGRTTPGYRALFLGPPDTGKRLAVALLGQACGMPAYRIDVSKYAGEPLRPVVKRAGAILFFDEADSLFARRTRNRDAHDHAANQQVAYLLQRIEDFPGIVILAANIRARLDDAFARRFQSVIRFKARASSRARRAARPAR